MRLTRRRFAAVLALLAGGAGLSLLIRWQAGGAPETSLKLALEHFLGGLGSADAIGAEYLRHHNDDPAELLSQIIPADLSDAERVEDYLRTEFRRRVREDFASGNTGRVHNWILSRSELRLCALVHLAAGAA